MGVVYASARQEGLTDEMLAALPEYERSPFFSPREKAALRFAAILAGNHLQASQELIDDLRQYFGESEILALGWRIATFVGYGRLVYAMGLESVGGLCPLTAAHSQDSIRTPLTPGG